MLTKQQVKELVKENIEHGTLIEANFILDLLASCPDGMPAEHIDLIRSAYFMGATFMLEFLGKISDRSNSPEMAKAGQVVVHTMQAEITAYAKRQNVKPDDETLQ